MLIFVTVFLTQVLCWKIKLDIGGIAGIISILNIVLCFLSLL